MKYVIILVTIITASACYLPVETGESIPGPTKCETLCNGSAHGEQCIIDCEAKAAPK